LVLSAEFSRLLNFYWVAFCFAPLHKNRAVRGYGVLRASGALHTLRVHYHPCHKTKKEKKTFTFSSLFYMESRLFGASFIFTGRLDV